MIDFTEEELAYLGSLCSVSMSDPMMKSCLLNSFSYTSGLDIKLEVMAQQVQGKIQETLKDNPSLLFTKYIKNEVPFKLDGHVVEFRDDALYIEGGLLLYELIEEMLILISGAVKINQKKVKLETKDFKIVINDLGIYIKVGGLHLKTNKQILNLLAQKIEENTKLLLPRID